MLADGNAKVAVAARRVDLLEKMAADFDAAGSTMMPVQMDIASLDSVAEAIARIEAELGPIEILINNAGVLLEGKALNVSEQEFDRLFAINVKGTFFVTQMCGRRMVDLGIAGKIVNIASVAGLITMPQLAVYGLSKAALIHLTKALAQEWARHDISINAICPGFVETDMNASFFASPQGRKVIERLPKHRLAPEDSLDELLLLLISETRSRFINGAVITVDDGFSVS